MATKDREDIWGAQRRNTRIDLVALRALLLVADAGSFSAAATQSGLSRSMIRRRVEELEALAGAPLLERSQQGVKLTRVGESFASRSREMLLETKTLLTQVRDMGRFVVGSVRLTVPLGFSPTLLGSWLLALWELHPKLRIHLEPSIDPLASLLKGADAAVHFGAPPSTGEWTTHKLWTVERRLLASKMYVDSHPPIHQVEDLAQHALAVPTSVMGPPCALPLRDGGTVEVDPSVVATDPNFARVYAAVGLGVGFVLGSQRRLTPVLPNMVGDELSLNLTVHAQLSDAPRIHALFEFTRNRAWT